MVSLLLITYNASEFVTEMLESIKAQTYADLELIISDDCSKDHTVQICEKWLSENKVRFVETRLITVPENTGIAANCNRALHAAKGDWIKFCAGDDRLLPDCIANNMAYIQSHPDVKILFSKLEVYNQYFNADSFVRVIPADPFQSNSIMAPDRTAASQYKMLLICDRIHYTPSLFIHRDTLLSQGGFDDSLRLLEDYPMWLKLTRSGHKLHFMDKITVQYRIHVNAVNNTSKKFLINPNFFRAEGFRKKYTYPFLPIDIRLNQQYIWLVSLVFKPRCLNRDHVVFRFILQLLTIYLNPFHYFIRFRKAIQTGLDKNEFYN